MNLSRRSRVGRVLQYAALPPMFAIGIAFIVAGPASAAQYSVVDLGPGIDPAINNLGQVAFSTNIEGDQHVMLYSAGTGLADLGPLPGAHVTGMNDSGQIVGYANVGGFVLTPGVGTAVVMSEAYAINNAGQVVGYDSGLGSAILYIPGIGQTDLGPSLNSQFDGLGGPPYTSRGTGINNAGEITGVFEWGPTQRFASGFLYPDLTSLSAFGADIVNPAAINDSGQIVGTAFGPQPALAFLYTPGVGVSSLGTIGGVPGANYAQEAFDINNVGQVVGIASGITPFIWSASTGLLDLNGLISPFYDLTSAQEINDSGQIVAVGGNHVFLLNPVPEPATITLLASAFLVIGGMRFLRWPA